MVNSPKCYRIYWRSLVTDASGNGLRILSYEKARELVVLLNKKRSGYINHWIE